MIRLRARGVAEPGEGGAEPGDLSVRRGFDYLTFEARLESLWFQRKTLMSDGGQSEASRQVEQIRAFCTEEGVRRLEYMAAALVVEAGTLLDEGRHDAALQSLQLAEFFDPGRPQIRMVRAHVFWSAGRGVLASAREVAAAVKGSILQSARDFSLINRVGLVLVVALFGSVAAFSLFMLVRHNVALRHEIEEWIDHAVGNRWAAIAGWALLGAPLLVWVGAGWCAVYWIVLLFRYMNRAERLTAAVLLLAGALSVPGYRMAVGFYGVTADPLVRATLASADGEYNPDRVIKLQRLVDAHSEDATYRFLLAALYRNGRYFEDAFQEYKSVLRIDPSHTRAWINVGNIFYITGQHPEAVANYREAIELEPGNALAWFNLHMAQSELFRFKEAEASLMEARKVDPELVAELLSEAGARGDRASVRDAGLDTASVWDAALGGRGAESSEEGTPLRAGLLEQSLNGVTLGFVLALIAACVLGVVSMRGDPARPCIRCGRPFCHYCKSSRNGQEYCSQCLHLFVLGHGLAPEAKRKKIYEIERRERWSGLRNRVVGFVLPGAAQVLGGAALAGTLLMTAWFVGLVLAWPGVLSPVEWALGLDLRIDLLDAGPVPVLYAINPLLIVGSVLLITVWLLGNVRRRRRGEA